MSHPISDKNMPTGEDMSNASPVIKLSIGKKWTLDILFQSQQEVYYILRKQTSTRNAPTVIVMDQTTPVTILEKLLKKKSVRLVLEDLKNSKMKPTH